RSPVAWPASTAKMRVASSAARAAKSAICSALESVQNSFIGTTSSCSQPIRKRSDVSALEISDLEQTLENMGKRARKAARVLAFASAERKHAALIGAAESVSRNMQSILAANAQDVAAAEKKGLSRAFVDRLTLDENRLRGVVDGL